MYTTLATLIDRLDTFALSGTSVIPWSSPVPSFGDLSSSRVATLGLNPSNREFVDESGNELQGPYRRFHTLNSLGLSSWSDLDSRHLRLILESCRAYFLGNPYDRWFRILDQVIAGAKASYYNAASAACHLDLIPYATEHKWTALSAHQRSSLLGIAGNTLAVLLRDSPVKVLILNGRSVVEQFEATAAISLERREIAEWALPRQAGHGVPGIAYRGIVETVSGIALEHKVLILGFNHNLQSSFGVTTKVIHAIRDWIAQASNGATQ